ncbi:unnamed protein product [Porites evermanni]|uniref:G-protein coupled receptors family 1 profile domain-containing protein n=1 Tax=Porites evermanni TaxID=104178 RepID=A0ABN8SB54_9CNID|nr:unnamed protein product [Porites evermanni]
MANATLNQTTLSETVLIYICPHLPIEVQTLPYMANTTAQVITLLTCIGNGISCPVATVENLLVFAVILKIRSLWTVFNTSVLCLAFTDLLIAMFAQPAFIAYQTGKYISSFACISFITLALITLERHFAVFKPFHYRASVTRFRVLRVTLSGWIAWTVFSFGLRFSPNGMNLKTYSIVSSILISFTLIETVFVYIKLYNATKIKDCSVKTVKGLNPGVISKVG